MITTESEHRKLEARYMTPMDRAEKVMASCVTDDQRVVAEKYMRLAARRQYKSWYMASYVLLQRGHAL